MKTLRLMSKALLVMSLMMTSCDKQDIEDPGKKIVMLGDSETQKINLFSTWNTELGTTNTVNLGFNGYQTVHIMTFGATPPLQMAINEAPELLFLTIGVNDVLTGTAEATTVANIKSMCDTLISNNINVIVNLITPLTAARNLTFGAGSGVYNQNIHDLNIAIGDMCTANQFEYIDQRPYMCERNLSGIYELSEEFSSDGLHYNLEGYQQWVIPLSYSINQH